MAQSDINVKVKVKVKTIIKFFEACLRENNVRLSNIILFGSHSKGTATGESDLDLVIVSEDFHGKDIFQRVTLFKDPEIRTIRKFMVPLDIVALTPEEFESETSLVAGFAKDGLEITKTRQPKKRLQASGIRH